MYEIKSTQAANQTWSVGEKQGTVFSIRGGETRELGVVKGKMTEAQVAKVIREAKHCKDIKVKGVTNG